jgi:hypothetical protein
MIMFRLVVITYLTISAALGPAFCCCHINKIFPWLGSTSCCGKANASLTEPNQHSHRHSHYSGGSADHHPDKDIGHPDKDIGFDTANNQLQPDSNHESHKPCESKCPCGKEDPGLIVSYSDASSLVAISVGMAWPFVDYSSLAQTELSGKAAISGIKTPAALSGREILRAYQTMRC